jgi:hypothetical protein
MRRLPTVVVTRLHAMGLCATWGLLVVLMTPPVMAMQPPAPDAELQQCDPIRQEILRLNQKPTWMTPLFQPKIARLKRRYAQCFQSIQTDEFKYLKQAQIPGHPGPKLPESPPDKPKKRAWWRW